MITVRRAADRGHADHGWLVTHHTFSFADYHDPDFMGYRSLRVINEDVVAPGTGFGTHGHRDMEIVTYVLSGAVAHKDSMGNGSVIRPGEVQRMTAGTGVRHSEHNPSSTEPLHLLQIWIMPERTGLAPGYEQKPTPAEARQGRLQLIASRDGGDGSVVIHQDARIYAANLAPGDVVTHRPGAGRGTWIQVARGSVRVGDHDLAAGDGASAEGEKEIRVVGVDDAELLLFDLA